MRYSGLEEKALWVSGDAVSAPQSSTANVEMWAMQWRCTPLIPALRRQSEDSLGYTVSSETDKATQKPVSKKNKHLNVV